MHYWIDDPSTLTARIAAWGHVSSIALDTEFIRERTWWPQLALVQLAAPGDAAALLVDPTIPGMADALRPLLADPAIVKLMHSASEDLQALLHTCKIAPAPLFDTQIAAALCGIGAGMGYQRLVETLLGIALPKDQTRSDWLRRPLSPAQCDYAADDVLHLHAIHTQLQERLHDLGRTPWLDEDSARLVTAIATDAPDPWPHLALRGAQDLEPDAQARLCRLLRWREATARASDRPKGWVLDNALALALARRPPSNIHAFHSLLDATPKAPRRSRGELWQLLHAAPGGDQMDLPLAIAPDSAGKQRLKAMQEAVAAHAERIGIDAGILASRRTLEALLDPRQRDTALTGWRRELLAPVLAPLI
ncbi:MAG: ribonuclease D [Proteobacteria bacterium]|nr:ribonuclease D [Pseudomonadota bacterium]MBS0462440.1 ribonuclease D [Pseudomonadota bacterium]